MVISAMKKNQGKVTEVIGRWGVGKEDTETRMSKGPCEELTSEQRSG